MIEPPQSRAVPRGIRVDSIDGGRMVTRSWRNPSSWALLPIFLMFCGIIAALFHATHLSAPDHPGRWFPIGFAGCGLVFFYVILVRLFNRTRLRITPDLVHVDHGPFPAKWSAVVPIRNARCIRVMPVEFSYSSRKALHWHLSVVRGDQSEILLLSHDLDREQARFIAAEISRVTEKPVEDPELGSRIAG